MDQTFNTRPSDLCHELVGLLVRPSIRPLLGYWIRGLADYVGADQINPIVLEWLAANYRIRSDDVYAVRFPNGLRAYIEHRIIRYRAILAVLRVLLISLHTSPKLLLLVFVANILSPTASRNR